MENFSQLSVLSPHNLVISKVSTISLNTITMSSIFPKRRRIFASIELGKPMVKDGDQGIFINAAKPWMMYHAESKGRSCTSFVNKQNCRKKGIQK
jgi:hypothetical protein